VTNRTDWTVGSVEFVNIFGYRNTSLAFSRDSGTPRAIADGSGVLPAGTPLDLIVAATEDHTDQFTDEVQLHGQALTGRLQWLVGGFYLKSKPAGPQSNLVGFAEVPGYDTATTSYNFITETSKAVFGDLRVDLGDLLDGLQFEAGARRTWDKIRSCTASGNSSGNILPEECDAASPLLINPAIEVASSVSNARPNLGKN
jgi:iron complex outermembrane receptor protein